jgi:flap endonuclease-1
MGITGLNPFLLKSFGNIWTTKLIVSIGKSISIDTNNWIYSPASKALKFMVADMDVVNNDIDRNLFIKYLKQSVIDFAKMWIEYGITPIFVFDGRSPQEKSETKEKRSARPAKLREDIQKLRDELRGQDRILVSGYKIAELKKLIVQDIYVTYDEMMMIREMILDLGIPAVHCTGEGEKLCSALALTGMADAVFSTDTDNLVYGTPLLVHSQESFDKDERGVHMPTFKTITTNDVIKALELSQKEFVDFCIMCGCDYNKNIPKVGIKRAYDLIKVHRSIENLPSKYDTTCLKHVKCRELFTIGNYQDLIASGRLEKSRNAYEDKGRAMLKDMKLHAEISIFNKFHMN